MNMARKPCNQAEVEKLITEKNVVGSKKSRLEGARIFSLVLTLVKFTCVKFTSYTILFLAKTIELCGKYRVCEKCIRRMASITGRI